MPHFCQSKQFVHLYYSSAFLKLCRKQGGWVSGGETRCSLSSSSFSPLTIPHPPPPSPPPPRFLPPPQGRGSFFFFFFAIVTEQRGVRRRRRRRGEKKRGGSRWALTDNWLSVVMCFIYMFIPSIVAGGCSPLPFPYGLAIVWRHHPLLMEAGKVFCVDVEGNEGLFCWSVWDVAGYLTDEQVSLHAG